MHTTARRALLLASLAAGLVSADLEIYTDGALNAGFENWSWSTDINWAATDLYEGLSSASINSQAWAALSLYAETDFSTYAGLKFDIATAAPDQLQFYIQATGDNSQSTTYQLTQFSKTINANGFTTIVVNFSNLPDGTTLPTALWNRINWQAEANGCIYHLDNVALLTSIVVKPQFLSAEPLSTNLVTVTSVGAVDFSQVKVKLNNATVSVTSKTTYVPPDTPSQTITYLTLGTLLAPGNLTITAGNATYNYVLPAPIYGSVTTGNSHAINPLIYGVNFPTSASYIQNLGVTVSRWGGNAVTPYNPFGDFTNAGNDWFFENRVSDNGKADDWLGWVSGAGSKTMLTVPALDWVAKDSTSYSYPKTVYPDQSKFDPYNPDAGSGVYANGSYVLPAPDPTHAYTPWNTSLAIKWLKALAHKPDIVTIDNEIEIASNTHQDMHPIPINYDEELARVYNFSVAVKTALPNVKIGAPSTCSWWFYWTSQVGYTDNAAHGNVDFLPWFLQQMKAKEAVAGKRLLDYLDIHYYYQPDTSANDDAAKALRLRMTRSLWDPTYIDESWAGSNPQNHQPNPTAIWLIPRMKALINQYYPGTLLSISEWASTNDNDITGGLVTVDQLGLYGVYGVDAATYWATPNEKGPVGLAFWLFRGNGRFFAGSSAQVNLSKVVEGVLGVYAATNSGNNFSLVLLNKDTKAVGLSISNVPAGKYFLRHFGGAAGVAKWQTTVNLNAYPNYIVVPAYTAVFLQQY